MIDNSLLTKYLVFAIVIGLALKFVPQVQMSDQKIFQTVALGTLVLFVVEQCFGNMFENMEAEMGEEIMPEEDVPPVGCNSCVGWYACKDAAGPIGEGSCNRPSACYETAGSIGDGSCSEKWSCLKLKCELNYYYSSSFEFKTLAKTSRSL